MPKFSTEKELISFLDRLDDEAGNARGRNDLDKRMEDSLNSVRGKQWRGDQPPYFLYNVTASAIEDKTGKLSETRPKISVLPSKDGLGDAAEILTKCVTSIWDKNKIEYATERIANYASLAGVAFVATPFNRNANHGNGDIDFAIKDPRCCAVDPSIVMPEKLCDAEYVITEDFQPLDLIQREYAGRGALVKPSAKIAGFETAPDSKSPAAMLRGVLSRMFGPGSKSKGSVIPKAITKEYFIKDRRGDIEDDGPVPITQTTTKWNEDEGGKNPFPGGRRIIRSEDIILFDSWNPYWDGEPPIDALSWKIDLETMWGPDEIEGVKRMQEAVNRLGDAYTRTTILNSVIRVVLDHNALSPEERNKLSNTAAEIIEKAPGRSMEYMLPTVLPFDIINFVNQLIDWMRQRIGVTIPPTQKNVPSIVTGPAIEGLQLMIETPIRTAARRIEEFYQRIGQKLVCRVLQFYTSDRILHMVAPDGKWVNFEFKRYNLLAKADGTPRSESDLRKYYQDFFFSIEPGSSLAITRTQRAMMAFQLVSAGLLHPREVLVELGYANPDEKVKEAMKAKAMGMSPEPGKGAGSQSVGQSGLVQ